MGFVDLGALRLTRLPHYMSLATADERKVALRHGCTIQIQRVREAVENPGFWAMCDGLSGGELPIPALNPTGLRPALNATTLDGNAKSCDELAGLQVDSVRCCIDASRLALVSARGRLGPYPPDPLCRELPAPAGRIDRLDDGRGAPFGPGIGGSLCGSPPAPVWQVTFELCSRLTSRCSSRTPRASARRSARAATPRAAPAAPRGRDTLERDLGVRC